MGTGALFFSAGRTNKETTIHLAPGAISAFFFSCAAEGDKSQFLALCISIMYNIYGDAFY